MESSTRARLGRFLESRFSISELEAVLFRLEVDAEALPRQTKSQFAREIVNYFTRRGQLRLLTEEVLRDRPDPALEALLAKIPEKGQPYWRADVGQPVLSRPAILPSDGESPANLIVGYGRRGLSTGGVAVLNAETGAIVFLRDLGASVEGGITVRGQEAVFGDDHGRLHCLDVRRQTDLWECSLQGAIHGAPLADEACIYAGTSEGVVAVVDARTGRIVRQARIPARETARPARIAGGLALSNRGVLVSAMDGGLYLFPTYDTGVVRLFDAKEPIYTTPVIHHTLAVLGTAGGTVCAVDLRTATSAWTFAAGGAIRSTPLLAGGVLYVASHDHALYALSASTGQELWRISLGHTIVTTPILSHGLLIFADNRGMAAAIDPATREEVWRFDFQADRPGMDRMPAAVLGGFASHEAAVICGSVNGLVYSLPFALGNSEYPGEEVT